MQKSSACPFLGILNKPLLAFCEAFFKGKIVFNVLLRINTEYSHGIQKTHHHPVVHTEIILNIIHILRISTLGPLNHGHKVGILILSVFIQRIVIHRLKLLFVGLVNLTHMKVFLQRYEFKTEVRVLNVKTIF